MDPRWKFPTFEIDDPQPVADPEDPLITIPALPPPTRVAQPSDGASNRVIRKTEAEMLCMVGEVASFMRQLTSWVTQPLGLLDDMPANQHKPRQMSKEAPRSSKAVIGAELLGKPKDASKAYTSTVGNKAPAPSLASGPVATPSPGGTNVARPQQVPKGPTTLPTKTPAEQPVPTKTPTALPSKTPEAQPVPTKTPTVLPSKTPPGGSAVHVKPAGAATASAPMVRLMTTTPTQKATSPNRVVARRSCSLLCAHQQRWLVARPWTRARTV